MIPFNITKVLMVGIFDCANRKECYKAIANDVFCLHNGNQLFEGLHPVISALFFILFRYMNILSFVVLFIIFKQYDLMSKLDRSGLGHWLRIW